MRHNRQFLHLLVFIVSPCAAGGAEPAFQFGFGKADITPTTSLRLSGYGNRSEVAEGIDTPLLVRAMAIRDRQQQLSVLASVDTIGLAGTFTAEIAQRVANAHGIPRSRFVISCTHSHTAPHLSAGLDNLLATPLTQQESIDAERYTQRLADRVLAAVKQSIDDLQPGRLYAAVGNVGFARNRRLVDQGRWAGFGVQPEGPTDHRLPVLRIDDAEGKLRGVVFNYACHCTTFGGNYNRVNGDWAGYAPAMIEAAHPDVTALCTIGCGADQNPVRDDDPQRALALAEAHGNEIASEVGRIIAGDMSDVDGKMTTSFGYAGLPFDRPKVDELKEALEDRAPQTRRHAQNMLELEQRMGRLPETYPAPVQVWQFGRQLCMVFLGGEVVVDYALRLEQEIDSQLVWTSAYCNDVFAYVASDRILREGGYEVAGSMIYYNQPGPWQEGVEEVLVRRVHELVEEGNFAGPFSPEEALKTFRLADEFEIDLVAAEPLITDPVNFEVGADGRLWVVEMGDYPTGDTDSETSGGRVKVLQDTDGDGRYDVAQVFLDGLSYPNGVFPWGDGVLVSCAPAILWAQDVNGDGRADVVDKLYTGFDEANPQHRMNGFALGLDNWLYLAGSSNNGRVTSVATGETVDLGSQDFRIQPDLGLIRPIGGHTQFGRNRNDWGDWFGGDNSRPLQHFVLSNRYVRRNPFVALPGATVDLLTPPFAPPVFPSSRTLDRFNDLFAVDRFTSACSPMIFRDASLGADVRDAAFICEPVHNLVHRARLRDNGVTFTADRFPEERSAEFLSSTDHWFRPTTAKTGPDGGLWIADMYRQVIEHPEWIPEAWQEQLDLRAGHDRGRIYRIRRHGSSLAQIPDLASMNGAALAAELEHPNGWRRDTAQRLLVERRDPSAVKTLIELLRQSPLPQAKVHALSTLTGLDELIAEHLVAGLNDADPRVVRHAVMLSEGMLSPSFPVAQRGAVGQHLVELTDHPDPRVRFQLALTLGGWDDDAAAEALARLAESGADDPWQRSAVLSSSRRHALPILTQLLRDAAPSEGRSQLVQDLIATAVGAGQSPQRMQLLALIATTDQPTKLWQIEALASFDRALRRRQSSFVQLSEQAEGPDRQLIEQAHLVEDAARRLASDDSAPWEDRRAALALLGRGAEQRSKDLELLARLISPQQPADLQLAAVAHLAQFPDPKIGESLLRNWPALSPQVRSAVLAALLSRPEWRERLIAALVQEDIRPIDLNAATRAELLTVGEPAARERIAGVLRDQPGDDRDDALEQYRDVGGLAGDARRGAERFAAVCAACHRHAEIGNDFGPKLAALSDKSSEALLTAILDPNRAIEEKYLGYTCLTTDGRTINGMLIAENAGSITMVRPDGAQQVVLRVDLESLSSSGLSFMPVGLERDLTPQDLADLFAFIRQESPSVQ